MMDVWGKGGVKWDVLYMTRVTEELLHDNLHLPAEPHNHYDYLRKQCRDSI